MNKRLSVLLLMVLAFPASAIEFSRLFAAAPGGIEGDHFPADTATIYIRYAYGQAQPGQTLNSYWIIEESAESESGQFSNSKVTLKKASDIGQFSFSPEQGWPKGKYQVVLTDDENQIVGEVLFRMGDLPATTLTPAPIQPVPQDTAAMDTPAINKVPDNSAQNVAQDIRDTETSATSDSTSARPLFEYVEPTPPPLIPDLLVSDVTLAGPDKNNRPGKASGSFYSNTPVINLRFQYQQAQNGESIEALWTHQNTAKEQPGSGLFAQSQQTLRSTQGKAHFAFHPEGKTWLPGRYEVELIARNQTLARAHFDVKAPPKKVVKKPRKPAKKVVKAKPPKKKVVTRSPKVLEAVLAKSIENARPKDPTNEYTNVWRRLYLWARIDGGNKNTVITSRWYTGKSGGELQATHRQTLTPGENWVVFWLHLKNTEEMLPTGPARVELNWGKKRLKTIHYNVKQAGFFDGLSDSFKLMGTEIQWLLDQNLDN